MSASDIFESVVNELIMCNVSDEDVCRVVSKLIEVLVERGWDDVESSIGQYTHSGVLWAANELGYLAYDQIPEDGTLSEVKIRCRCCKRMVRYWRTEFEEIVSETHARVEGRSGDVCPFSCKSPQGY